MKSAVTICRHKRRCILLGGHNSWFGENYQKSNHDLFFRSCLSIKFSKEFKISCFLKFTKGISATMLSQKTTSLFKSSLGRTVDLVAQKEGTFLCYN